MDYIISAIKLIWKSFQIVVLILLAGLTILFFMPDDTRDQFLRSVIAKDEPIKRITSACKSDATNSDAACECFSDYLKQYEKDGNLTNEHLDFVALYFENKTDKAAGTRMTERLGSDRMLLIGVAAKSCGIEGY